MSTAEWIIVVAALGVISWTIFLRWKTDRDYRRWQEDKNHAERQESLKAEERLMRNYKE